MTETKITTAIWDETPEPGNPFLAASCRCHGYDLLELCRECSFVEVLLLLFTGELPDPGKKTLLEKLMIGLINPGPRHPATRAAINAGLGRTAAENILPIALASLSGTHLGAGEVALSMHFLAENAAAPTGDIARLALARSPRPLAGDWHPAPGFGSRYGGIDPLPQQLAEILRAESGCGDHLRWASAFAAELAPHGLGFLATGLAAAVFSDLGLSPWCGAGLFQLLAAPGLLAHGIEAGGQPVATMPSIFDQQNYVIRNLEKDDETRI